MISIGGFFRRKNPDSTIDLICPKCFQTAASGKSESEALTAAAKEHTHCGSLEPGHKHSVVQQERRTQNGQRLPR
jgi:hypothetical protein